MSTIDELTALEAAISRTDDEQAARYRELIEINAFLVSQAAGGYLTSEKDEEITI